MTRVFAILLTVVSLVAAVYLWREREALEAEYAATRAAQGEDAKAARGVGVSDSGRTAPMVRAAAVVPAPAPRVTLSPEMRQFRERRGYKDLYERLSALADPTPEQKYILAEINSQCGSWQQRQQEAMAKKAAPDPVQVRADFAAALSPKDPNREARLEAYDRALSRPCDGIQFTGNNYKALMEAAAAGGDPKARLRLLQQEIWNPPGRKQGEPVRSISEAHIAALRQFALSDDPVAATGALQFLVTSAQNYSIRVGPWEQPVDDEAYRSAVSLLGCELGLDCGRDSFELAHACAMQNHCGVTDLREYLLTYRLPAASSGTVDEYLQGLRRARAGDWSYFTVVSGPTPQASIFNRR